MAHFAGVTDTGDEVSRLLPGTAETGRRAFSVSAVLKNNILRSCE